MISQKPSAGTKVPVGSSVTLVVSLGEEPPAKVVVPPVIGTAEEDARQMIQSAGLTVSDTTIYESSSLEKGLVIRCDPGVGTSLDQGQSVTLVVSQGPATPSGDGEGDPPENEESPE